MLQYLPAQVPEGFKLISIDGVGVDEISQRTLVFIGEVAGEDQTVTFCFAQTTAQADDACPDAARVDNPRETSLPVLRIEASQVQDWLAGFGAEPPDTNALESLAYLD